MTKENLKRKKALYAAVFALSMGAGICAINKQKEAKEENSYVTYEEGEKKIANISDIEADKEVLFLYKDNITGEIIKYDAPMNEDNYDYMGSEVVIKTNTLRK